MRYPIPLLLASIVLLTLVACAGDGKLTNEKAIGALKQWKPGRNPTSTGIQEIPQQNTATVVFNFSNCTFGSGSNTGSYTGDGTATFTHYNDGRWVLTQVSGRLRGFGQFVDDKLNIEAK